MRMTELESPFTGGPVEGTVEARAYEMRGQQITINVPTYRCVDTGELFSTGEQDEFFLAELHRQYRERNNVPTPSALKARREELGISAREASQLLGFGINQFSLYEAGEMPTSANTTLLRLFCNPQLLRGIVESQMYVLPKKLLSKLSVAVKAVPQL
ncbi:MAG: hypothetical protein EOO61_17730, partial [Hymenobacter sp.]